MALKGQNGIVKVGSSPAEIAEIESWNASIAKKTAESTAKGDNWETHQTFTKGWSGSITCFWDPTDTNGQIALDVDTAVDLELYPEDDESGDSFYEGSALITEISIDSPKDDYVRATFSFLGTGALTLSTVGA